MLLSKAMPLHELKVQVKECFTLTTQDSMGHLKTLCMTPQGFIASMAWKYSF